MRDTKEGQETRGMKFNLMSVDQPGKPIGFWSLTWKSRTSFTVVSGVARPVREENDYSFDSPNEAQEKSRQLAREMLAQGYKLNSGAIAKILDNVPAAKDPKAVCFLCIGEHTLNELAADICNYLTACAQTGMTAHQFKEILSRLEDEEGEHLEDTLGHAGEHFWFDKNKIDWTEGSLDGFYSRAVTSGADRFIFVNSDAFVYLVALRGDPGVKEIQICIFGDKGCKDKKGEWLDVLPSEPGPGFPVCSIIGKDVNLRGGKTFPASEK